MHFVAAESNEEFVIRRPLHEGNRIARMLIKAALSVRSLIDTLLLTRLKPG